MRVIFNFETIYESFTLTFKDLRLVSLHTLKQVFEKIKHLGFLIPPTYPFSVSRVKQKRDKSLNISKKL